MYKGISSEADSLVSRVAQEEKNVLAAKNQLAKLQLALRHAEKEFEALQNGSNADGGNYEKICEEVAQTETEITSLQQQLENLHFDPDGFQSAQQELKVLENEAAEIQEKLDKMKSSSLGVLLAFSKEFDTNQNVYGRAFELMKVREDSLSYSVALEEAGKSRLLQVVVSDDAIAQRVLETSKSKQRISCIPLNKIRSADLPIEKVELAKKLDSQNSVVYPLEIIVPDDQSYNSAFKYVFGSTVLCKKKEVAEQIAKEPKIRLPAITIQGDSYNPSGSISGGSKAGLDNLLLSYRHYVELEEKKGALKANIQDLEKKASTKNVQKQHQELTRQIKLLNVHLHGAKQRQEQLEANGNDGKLKKFNIEIQSLRVQIKELEENDIPRAEEQYHKVKKDLDDSPEIREKKVQTFEKRLKEIKKERKQKEKVSDAHEKNTGDMKLKEAVVKERVADAKEKLRIAEEETLSISEEINASQKNLEGQKIKVANSTEKLNAFESQIEENQNNLQQIQMERQNLSHQLQDLQSYLKKSQTDVKHLTKNVSARESNIANYLRSHSWLKEVREDSIAKMVKPKSLANIPDKYEEWMQEIEKMETELNGIQKRVNVKAVEKLDIAEKEHENLATKRTQIKKDKESIEDFIRDLDDKKCKTLDLCWQQVNKNFSDIFNSLLPEANCRLNAINPKDVSDGLEMNVKFGNNWKSSLTELSGGQRSLLALSLILALLKYKPAPLYILDEVDAALDMSHTQNIGRMIKDHFKSSQFLVVSLKENLFQHADVLFRTQFVEGTSVVQRIEKSNKSEKSKVEGLKENRKIKN
eukprot:GHVP01060928.1.p1 GENE.GHVP01060928.1~~GHVP01060928.1.p1  ORF type:complete len:812 (-),score=229.04 GHVP01060928.1:1808-4243(-)